MIEVGWQILIYNAKINYSYNAQLKQYSKNSS